MRDFIENLTSFLDNKFDADTSLEKKPKGEVAYSRFEPSATTPFYAIQIIDDSLSNEDFNKEVSSNISIQIFLYGVKMRLNNKLTSAQDISIYLFDKCKSFMNEYKYSNTSNILELRRTGSTPALPYEKGDKAYYSVLRYNIKIKE